MSYPLAIPPAAVCEVSQRYGNQGSATVVYQIKKTGKIIFSGSYRDSGGGVAAPAMEGQLNVRPR